MAASFLSSSAFFIAAKSGHPIDDSIVLVSTVCFTTIVWLAVTFLTPPVDDATLETFYRKVRPAGPGWERLRLRTGAPPSPDSLPTGLAGWICGLVAIYSALFGAGAFLYGNAAAGAAYCALFVLATAGVIRVTTMVWRPMAESALPRAM